MENSFRHFLITRYNVPLTGWEVDKRGVSTRDTTWLSHRLQLFIQYCFPSVIGQTQQNFTWLIYMDEQTPFIHLDRLRTLTSPHPHISIRTTAGYFECLADINQALQQAGAAYVITSRLDNDDAFGSQYIETIQQTFRPQHGLLINLLHGHGYDTLRQVGMRLRNIPQNSFMSLVEKCNPEGNHISIRGFQHDQPPAHFTMLNVDHAHSWLKIFHDRNLKSEPFGMPVWNNHFGGFYSVDTRHLPLSLPNTWHYFLWWLRDGFRRKVLKTTSIRRAS